MRRYWVREVGERDIDFMFEVKRSGMKDYVTATWGAWDDDEQRARFVALLTPQYDRIVVTSAGDVGTLSIAWDQEPAFLAGIYLAAGERNTGLGTAIIADILEQARERERAVELRVLRTNPAARRLYERLGFRVVGDTDTHVMMRSTSSLADPVTNAGESSE